MGNHPIFNIIDLGANKNDVFIGFFWAFFFKHLDILPDRFKTFLVSQVENNESTLTIPEVRSRERKELLLALRVPYLQSHGLIFDLQSQAFQVHANRTHLASFNKGVIHKSYQEAGLACARLSEHDYLILVLIAF